VGAALVAGLVLGVPAHADPTPETHTVHFSSPFTDPGTRPTGLGSCAAANPMVCDMRYGGTAAFTGALTTFVDYYGFMHYDPVNHVVEGEGWDHHTGSLQGCGEGSFVLHQTEERGDPTTADPATGTFRLTLKWEILPGSGTGDFQGARGSGTAWGDFHPDLSNTGTYTGTITCRGNQD
jgi:hypothetical protein